MNFKHNAFLYDLTHFYRDVARPSVPGVVDGDTGCGRPTSFSVACAMRAVPWSPDVAYSVHQ